MDSIDDLAEIKTATGSPKGGTALVVPVANSVRVEGEGLLVGVKASVTGGDAEDVTHTIEVPQAHHELPDDGVEARAQTPARDNRHSGIAGVHVDLLTWTGAVVGQARGGEEHDVVWCHVEALDLGRVKVRVVIQWVGSCLEVWDVVGEVGQLLQPYGFEQVGHVTVPVRKL